MGSGNDVLYCQSDLPSTAFAAFEGMRKRKQFCDLTIKVQNHSFPAHRMVIAAVIPYFRTLFTTNNGAETAEKEISIENLDPSALEALINFAYSGKVSISSANVQSLLATSQVLELNQVCDACVQFLTGSLNVRNVMQVRAFGCDINNPKLIENCNTWIRHNFEEFSKCPDFLNLPHLFIKEVISCDDLKVSNEEVVFDAVMSWVKNSADERQSLLPDLLTEIRLIFLSHEYLIDKIDANVLIKNFAPCRDLVNEAKYYHLLPKKKSLYTDLRTQPRTCWRTLYAVGFCSSCGPSVHYLDLMKGTWLTLAVNKVEQQAIHKVFYVNEEIYLFCQCTILLYSLKSGEWKVLKSNNYQLEGAAIASYEDRIYFFCTTYGTEVRYFDTQCKKWVQKGEMNIHRPYCAAVSLGSEYVYVTGGRGCVSSNCYSTVERYVPTTGEWSTAPSMLTARYGHGCSTLDSKIYVCGGWTSGGKVVLNTAEVYESDADQWTLISPMKNEMSSFSLVAHGNKIYALGKYGSEIYDAEANEWKFSSYVVPAGFIGAFSAVLCNGCQKGTS